MTAVNPSRYLATLASIESPFQFSDNPKSSPFHRKGYSVITPHLSARNLIAPEQVRDDYAGTTANFRIDRTHDFAGLVDLQIGYSAITANGTCTYKRLGNWAPFWTINNVQVVHNTNTLQQWQGIDMWPTYMLETPRATRDALDPHLLGNLSPGEREILGNHNQVAHCPFDLFGWWCKSTAHYLNTQSFSDEIRIKVNFHPASEWVQCDSTGTPTCTIGTITIGDKTYETGLVLHEHHVVEAERAYHNKKILHEGIMEPFIDYKTNNRDFKNAGQSNSYKVSLSSFNMSVQHLAFVVRNEADILTPFRKNYTKPLNIVGFHFTGNSTGGDFTNFVEARYNNGRMRDQYHSSDFDPAYPIYWYSWTLDPENHVDQLGTIQLGNILNPELVIWVGSSNGESEARDVSNGQHPSSSVGGSRLVTDATGQTFNLRQEFGGTPTTTF